MSSKRDTKRLNVFDIMRSIQALSIENEELERENERLKKCCINIDKFHARTFTVEQLAYLHDVHPNTIRKYIKCGLIPKHPNSSNGKILIRVSDGLTLDFEELRRKSKNLIYNEQ